ncbi:DAK2 domain-containing protein [Alicyclobacillaceae bacterium I2511]|nr:DAK2 domain-containing protein [Alicyclobacillaceae bacterium I2511]
MSEIDRLDVPAFIDFMRAGHLWLKAHVQAVNALNVFPVPDGDTGTNMELSLASGVTEIHNQHFLGLATVTQALATGLLMGARGNSGVILSQLFRGFAKVSQNRDYFDSPLLASAFQEGVTTAYGAVAKPVEGTILTVAREAAKAGTWEAKRTTGLVSLLSVMHETAKQALARTPEQLPVLKQAGVVDSGGQGFVYILEGFLKWLRQDGQFGIMEGQNPVNKEEEDRLLEFTFAGAHLAHEGEFGYCTEVLVRTKQTELDGAVNTLKKTLGAYGNSLLVVTSGDLIKVHVHTLQPGRVLQDALELGPLIKIKIDNMTEQNEILKQSSNGLPAVLPDEHGEQLISSLGVVVVAAGIGLQDIFSSLGASVILRGGQTMNPSTEELVAAVRQTGSSEVLLLPNNKNILMTAQQAQEVFEQSGSEVVLRVIPTQTIPEGIGAMVAYVPTHSLDENVATMSEAISHVNTGEVVRAVRDSVFQGEIIHENQYLGLANGKLVQVADDRLFVAVAVVHALKQTDSELLTIFYGDAVPVLETEQLSATLGVPFQLEVDVRNGGQPIFDYIFALE